MPRGKLLTEAYVDYLEKRFSEVFVTKEDFQNFKSELFNRIDALEEIHPQGKHPIMS